MFGHRRGPIAVAVVVSPLLVALAACGGSSEGDGGEGEGGAANLACSSDFTTTASTPLPGDVPAPAGADTAYDYFAQGATKVWFFALDGGPGDLASLRDSYDDTLKGKGYEIEDTDAEKGAEAESEFTGPHEGTTNFRPLCKGKVVLRLKLTS
jgi:hypothetical protein